MQQPPEIVRVEGPACIYCGELADSKEDWLPRGFGVFKGMTLLADRLCQKCNRELGHELDEEILNTGPTATLRSILQIKGRHKTSKNPFLYRSLQAESPTSILMPCDHGDYKILGHPKQDVPGGRVVVSALRQMVFKRETGEMVPIPFPHAYDADRLKELIRVRGLAGVPIAEVYLDEAETFEEVLPHLRLLLSTAGLSFKDLPVFGGKGSSGGRHDMTMSHAITMKYLRAIAKIGFHYYLWTSNVHVGSELLFEPIRRFVRVGDLDANNFVTMNGPQFIEDLRQGKVPVMMSHFFGIGTMGGQVTAVVQFYVAPDHLMPPAYVRLGVTRKHVEPRCHWIGHYGDRVDDADGEIKEIKLRHE